MTKRVLIGARIAGATSGELGVVRDTIYWRCYWQKLDQPTALFAEGSSGIEVCGPPTPRNVVFPSDTVHVDYHPDAFYHAEQMVHAVFPGKRRGMVELTPEMVVVYMTEYQRQVEALPATAAVHSTQSVHLLRHAEPIEATRRAVKAADGSTVEKVDHTEYFSLLTEKQVADLVSGATDVATLKASLTFLPTEDPHGKAFEIVKGKAQEIVVASADEGKA